MNEIVKWCVENARWVFSGIGVFGLSLVVGWAWARKHTQVIKGKSSGTQAGRDVKINKRGRGK